MVTPTERTELVKATGTLRGLPEGEGGGRPLAFETPEDLAKAIEDYFAACAATAGKHPTVTGLAVHVGLTRQALLNYSYREDYSQIFIRARSRIEAYIEERLYGANVAGCIFNLKNNFGWKDVQHVDNTHRPGQRAERLSDDELANIASGSGKRAITAQEGEE